MMHQQLFTEITPSKKHKVILAVQQQIPEDEDDCMHLVRIPNSGYLVCCNAPTGEDCLVCGRPTCPAHFSQRTRLLLIADREGSDSFAVCQACAQLPLEDQEAIRQVRLKLNGEKGRNSNG